MTCVKIVSKELFAEMRKKNHIYCVDFFLYDCILFIYCLTYELSRSSTFSPPLLSSFRQSLGCVYFAVMLTPVTDVNYLRGSEGDADCHVVPRKRTSKHFPALESSFIAKAIASVVHGLESRFHIPPSIISQ